MKENKRVFNLSEQTIEYIEYLKAFISFKEYIKLLIDGALIEEESWEYFTKDYDSLMYYLSTYLGQMITDELKEQMEAKIVCGR